MKQRREGEREILGEKISGRRYSYEAVATGRKETVGGKISGRRCSYGAVAIGKKKTMGKKMLGRRHSCEAVAIGEKKNCRGNVYVLHCMGLSTHSMAPMCGWWGKILLLLVYSIYNIFLSEIFMQLFFRLIFCLIKT